MITITTQTKLFASIFAVASLPWVITMIMDANVADIAMKIVNLGLGLY